jgi:MYXO-CTERM domain-containing protein
VVVVDLKVLFANAGRIEMTIRRLSDGETLFSHTGAADTWDDGSGGHDPKWGIYRSLNNRGDLRDEQVRFADFCVSHQDDCTDDAPPTPTPDAGTPPDAGAATDVAPPPRDGGAPSADASTGTPPPAGDPEPTPPPTKPANRSSGCTVGGHQSSAAFVALAAALALLARRRGRPRGDTRNKSSTADS